MDIVSAKLLPIDDIFDNVWLNSRPALSYALGKNQKYIEEVNAWLGFFQQKGWLDAKLIKRLQSANTWSSYYSKINELRAGYFFEKKLNLILSEYEVQTVGDKNVEFKSRRDDVDIFIEVKTPLHFLKKEIGWINIKGPWKKGDIIYEIYDCLDKAVMQLPNNSPTIVVLSDDLNVSLLDCPQHILNHIWTAFNSSEYMKVSVVCILGNIYHEDMYKMLWASNCNAKYQIDKAIFDGFNKIYQL